VADAALRQAPAGTDADYFILSFARKLRASMVSNDRFRDRIKQFPEAKERVIRYMILKQRSGARAPNPPAARRRGATDSRRNRAC
jgi:hypothetical protein